MMKKMIVLCTCMLLIAAMTSGCCCCISFEEMTPTLPDEQLSATVPESNQETAQSIILEQAITEPEEIVEPITEAPAEEPKQESQNDSNWKTAYINYLDNLQDENPYCEYRLVYVDSDHIPELFVYGGVESAGSTVCAYKNGQLVYADLYRLNGEAYIPQSGLVYNFNGKMGYYSVDIFRLTSSGFELVFHGLMEEVLEEYTDTNGQVDYRSYFLYSVADDRYDGYITEEEFYAAQAEVYDFSASENLYYYNDSRMYSYEGIILCINNW